MIEETKMSDDDDAGSLLVYLMALSDGGFDAAFARAAGNGPGSKRKVAAAVREALGDPSMTAAYRRSMGVWAATVEGLPDDAQLPPLPTDWMTEEKD
jgi:hypothetical protein